MFSLLLGSHLGMQRQGHIWDLHIYHFKKLSTVFQNGYIILHFHQQCLSVRDMDGITLMLTAVPCAVSSLQGLTCHWIPSLAKRLFTSITCVINWVVD
jgi:hypothetical protein